MTAVPPPHGSELAWYDITRGLAAGEQAISQVVNLLTWLTAAPTEDEHATEHAADPTALEDMRAFLTSAARDLRAAAALNPRPIRTHDRNLAVRQEWTELRAQLPVPVDVALYQNEGMRSTADTKCAQHIRVHDRLFAGRLQRDPGQTLCWTPSSNLQVYDVTDSGDHLYPTCPQCVRYAYRVARRPPSPLLLWKAR